MFYLLLLSSLMVATLVSFFVRRLFNKPIAKMLRRILDPDLAASWNSYLSYVIFVVGISGGVREHSLERYILPVVRGGKGAAIPSLTTERWVFELYRTLIGALESLAWMLFVFFLVTIVIYSFRSLAERKSRRALDEPQDK